MACDDGCGCDSDDCVNVRHLVACRPSCKDGECTNQTGNSILISFLVAELEMDEEKGRKLMAMKDIAKGEIFMEYSGLWMDGNEYENTEDKSYVIECIDDNEPRTWVNSDKEEGFYIDGREFGNLASFINHSCRPNSCFVFVSIRYVCGSMSNTCEKVFARGYRRMMVRAISDIKTGEEITASYGKDYKGSDGKYVSCLCDSDKCSKWIGIQNTHRASQLMRSHPHFFPEWALWNEDHAHAEEEENMELDCEQAEESQDSNSVIESQEAGAGEEREEEEEDNSQRSEEHKDRDDHGKEMDPVLAAGVYPHNGSLADQMVFTFGSYVKEKEKFNCIKGQKRVKGKAKDFKCMCGEKVTMKAGAGLMNVKRHIVRKHPEITDEIMHRLGYSLPQTLMEILDKKKAELGML